MCVRRSVRPHRIGGGAISPPPCCVRFGGRAGHRYPDRYQPRVLTPEASDARVDGRVSFRRVDVRFLLRKGFCTTLWIRLGTWTAAAALFVLATAGTPPADVLIRPGDPFPDLEFYGLLEPGDYPKLGLGKTSGPFRLSEIPGRVLVLEFFNKACVPCQTHVRQVEAAYQEILERGLGERIRVLGVAAGNLPKYLGRYRKRRKLTYPITADPHFEQWRRIGDPGRTPFTLFLVRRDGNWLLARYSFGIQWKNELLGHALTLDAAPETALQQESGLPPLRSGPLVIPVAEDKLRSMVVALMERVTGLKGLSAEPVRVPDGARVFRARRGDENLPVFVRVASRRPVCEVCEAVHFMFAFDAQGKLLGFQPIHVTKYGNEEWTEEDSRFFERRLKGRRLQDLTFDPQVDAVSMATMSSALIFDEVRRTAELLDRIAEGS